MALRHTQNQTGTVVGSEEPTCLPSPPSESWSLPALRDMIRKAASLGLAATLLATLGAAIAAAPALASTSVTSAGSMSPGTTSVGTASFTLTENSVNGFPNASGTVTVTITDSASASTVHFSGTPVLSAPGSLGATVALGPAGTSFTVTTRGADNLNIEPITVSGLRISADAGAALGPIKAAMSGSLVGGIISPTTTATGIAQTSVAVGSTGGVVVNVSSPCGFASTGGLNGNVTFSDVADSRALTGATALAGGQQTLTIGGGGSIHAIGTTITQMVADCLGVNLASPGTVGSGPTQHLAFIGQPGGGTAGVVWAVQPVVAVQNALNMVATGDSSTFVTLSIGTNPAGGTLSCTSGLSRTVVNGVATFFGCSISIGSPSAYTLTATSNPAWSPATSSAFLVSQSALSVVLTDSIAAGVNRGTMGFGTVSVVVPRGGWITLLGTTSPNLAGSLVQVWTRTKTGAWHVLTSRLAAADGTIHYFARVNGWTAYQLKFAGDSSHSAAASHGRIATSRT